MVVFTSTHLYISPILFTIYINDLAIEMFDSVLGILVDEERMPLLMYADDIVVLGQTVPETQQLLDIISMWCLKWGMKANEKKVRLCIAGIVKDQGPRCH